MKAMDWMNLFSHQSSNTNKFNPLRLVLQFPGIALVTFKRLRHFLGLSLLALINVILSVGLITNASFFSQAVDRVVLDQELKDFSSVTGRPPFSTSIYIFPSRSRPVTFEKAEELGAYIRQTIVSEVGLPLRHLGLELTSGNLILQPAPESRLFGQGQDNLGTVETVAIANVASQMAIVEGVPMDEKGSSKGSMDVWMYDSKAQSMGVHIGEKLLLSLNVSGAKVPIQVAGIWKAKDPKAEFWFSNPDSAYKNVVLVRRNDYINKVQPILGNGAGQVSWYVILDEKKVVPSQSQHYLEGFQRSLDIINKYIPGARMNMPPLDPLTKFVARSSALTVLLIGYNLPAFAILLYFLVLTSTIMAQWQRRETVMLVSRGMSLPGVLALTITEQGLLFVLGYPLGVAFGMLIANAMGYTESFLSFTWRAPLPVSFEGLNFPLTILALAFALFSRILPAVRAARSSLVTEEREHARPMQKPFWYRFYLDLILLVPTYYAYDQMVKHGSLAGLITSRPEDLYRDPLLVVVPALFILTTALASMRVFGWLMHGIDLIAGWIPWLTIHLALRQLGRQSLDYVRPLLLVVIALAMGVYTLAMAASLDQWTIDRMYYRTGSDFAFTPEGSGDTSGTLDGSWIPLPQDFVDIPGVKGATRIGNFDMRVSPDTSTEVRGKFLAVDRFDFSSVAWFRDDFTKDSLGAMMNLLAPYQEGVLVSDQFLKDRHMQIGDILTLQVDLKGIMSTVADYVIVGSYQYFPTVYDDTVTIIGNIDNFSTLTGFTPSFDLWMRLKPGTDTKVLQKNITEKLHIKLSNIRDTGALISAEQDRMERVGIFGTLTVSFLATALMAVLGLLIYSYASLHDRAYRLAVLNAVGLSKWQILTQVVTEYAFLALFGSATGAVIGISAARLFIPFFRYTGEKGIPLPPLIPVVSGEQFSILSLVFAATIIAVEAITITTVLRNQLVQILKRVWM